MAPSTHRIEPKCLASASPLRLLFSLFPWYSTRILLLPDGPPCFLQTLGNPNSKENNCLLPASGPRQASPFILTCLCGVGPLPIS